MDASVQESEEKEKRERKGRKEEEREGKGKRKGRKEKGREGRKREEKEKEKGRGEKKKEEEEEKKKGKQSGGRKATLKRTDCGRRFFFLLKKNQVDPFRGNPLSGQRNPFKGGGCHKTPLVVLFSDLKKDYKGCPHKKKTRFL